MSLGVVKVEYTVKNSGGNTVGTREDECNIASQQTPANITLGSMVTGGLVSGETYTVEVVATDVAGNTATKTIKFKYDNHAPTIAETKLVYSATERITAEEWETSGSEVSPVNDPFYINKVLDANYYAIKVTPTDVDGSDAGSGVAEGSLDATDTSWCTLLSPVGGAGNYYIVIDKDKLSISSKTLNLLAWYC